MTNIDKSLKTVFDINMKIRQLETDRDTVISQTKHANRMSYSEFEQAYYEYYSKQADRNFLR